VTVSEQFGDPAFPRPPGTAANDRDATRHGAPLRPIARPSPDDPIGSLQASGPTTGRERIASLDVLRGFALLGILVLNIETFSGPAMMHDVPVGTGHPAFVGWHASLDLAIFALKWAFFEGKMRTLFSMLYGAGIVLLADRMKRHGRAEHAAGLFYRRNLWLLLFGIVHGTLIWQGDILSQYALVALLFMFPLRRLAAKRLIVIGLAVGILGGTCGVVRMTNAPALLAADRLREAGRVAIRSHRPPSAEQARAIAKDASEQSALPHQVELAIQAGRRPYLQSIGPRTEGYLSFVEGLFRSGWIFEVIGSMLLGMGLFKTGFLTAGMSSRFYLAIAALGYLISAPIVILGIVMANASGFSTASITQWLFLPYELEVFAGAVANAAIILLVVRNGKGKAFTNALANVGRTAFSNYIMTSILCQSVFAWGPWKLYGAMEYYEQIYVVAAVWSINLAASALWLRHFNYGPLEWAWRSLVYWKRPEMLK